MPNFNFYRPKYMDLLIKMIIFLGRSIVVIAWDKPPLRFFNEACLVESMSNIC
ncbi:hypothetical protein FM106_32055 [Brachybacterium faecium]|nr:hypothetical protein FM106_32055 [Brachybacterium faecium]